MSVARSRPISDVAGWAASAGRRRRPPRGRRPPPCRAPCRAADVCVAMSSAIPLRADGRVDGADVIVVATLTAPRPALVKCDVASVRHAAALTSCAPVLRSPSMATGVESWGPLGAVHPARRPRGPAPRPARTHGARPAARPVDRQPQPDHSSRSSKAGVLARAARRDHRRRRSATATARHRPRAAALRRVKLTGDTAHGVLTDLRADILSAGRSRS